MQKNTVFPVFFLHYIHIEICEKTMLCFAYNNTTTDEYKYYLHEESKGLFMKNEIILYRPNEIAEHIEVKFDEETVWLTLDQIAELFQRDKSTVSRHIKNVFSEGELDRRATVAKFATVQNEGDRLVERIIEFFNLDVIISVGYRVKSQQGTQFRIWATEKLRDYLLNGYVVNKRLERLENRVIETENKIEFFVKTSLPPVQGIFCDGQIFDAYVFISDLIRQAVKSIVLIDNYIDDRILLIMSKRQVNVTAIIYTQKITPKIQLDLTKHNAQYEPISINTTTKFHDRFLIIDDTVYHIGASLKDLGKKLFAFSKMEINPADLLKNI